MSFKNIIHVVQSNKLFEVSNYLVWKVKIRVVLLEKEFWEYVDPIEKLDNNFNDWRTWAHQHIRNCYKARVASRIATRVKARKRANVVKRNKKYKVLLGNHHERQGWNSLLHCKSRWSKRSMGQASKVVCKLELCEDYVLIKQATSIHSRRRETYFWVVSSSLKMWPASSGKRMDDYKVVQIIINVLLESYDGFIDFVMGQDELPMMDKLINELLFQE